MFLLPLHYVTAVFAFILIIILICLSSISCLRIHMKGASVADRAGSERVLIQAFNGLKGELSGDELVCPFETYKKFLM